MIFVTLKWTFGAIHMTNIMTISIEENDTTTIPLNYQGTTLSFK